MSLLDSFGPRRNLAQLAQMSFEHLDFGPLSEALRQAIAENPNDADALMELSQIELILGERASSTALQEQALRLTRVFADPNNPEKPDLTAVAVCVAGDFMANTPLEFMLGGSGIALHRVYIGAGEALPEMPPHDAAIIAVGYSTANHALLEELKTHFAAWPRPVVNPAAGILRTGRDTMAPMFDGLQGAVVPPTIKLSRDESFGFAGQLRQHKAGQPPFPLLIRPLDSHAGTELELITAPEALDRYLKFHIRTGYFVSSFVDYRSPDGLFRKYRVAVIDGVPYPSHMGISEHWMIHYLNAGMTLSADKRTEEQRFMDEFETGFRRRHEAALRELWKRLGLEYFALDCAETPDGRLLVFEIDVAMIVHLMDPPDMFPYKHVHMPKVFAAYQAMLRRAAGR
ncbi:MAG TPA: RimK family alpha-L-glutamate ligase [Alphaproteobacteria bacterium]